MKVREIFFIWTSEATANMGVLAPRVVLYFLIMALTIRTASFWPVYPQVRMENAFFTQLQTTLPRGPDILGPHTGLLKSDVIFCY